MAWKLSSDPRISAQALERQMRNWELARTQRPGGLQGERPEVEDFITISREVGVAVGDVAQRLGRRLGWPVFDRNLLDSMAGDDAVRQRIYESLDQRDLKWWEEALVGLFDEGFVRNDYFHRLCESVLSLARQGNCIFVGRGCDRLLPDRLGFRVRLVAPAPMRLDRFARVRGFKQQEAQREMDRVESDRNHFLRNHFKVDAGDVTRHDLTINLERLSVDQAVDIVLDARRVRQRSLVGEKYASAHAE